MWILWLFLLEKCPFLFFLLWYEILSYANAPRRVLSVLVGKMYSCFILKSEEMGRRLKIFILFIAIVLTLSGMMASNLQRTTNVEIPKRNCRGYTVIEVDKGIDCNGDTVELVKKNGFFELALR